MSTSRKAYGSDVTDAEWTFLLPYLCLMREDAPQREHPLRELFNAVRYMVKTGVTWRYLPNDFPPWTRRLPAGAAVAAGRLFRAGRPRPAGDRAGAGRAATRPVGGDLR